MQTYVILLMHWVCQIKDTNPNGIKFAGIKMAAISWSAKMAAILIAANLASRDETTPGYLFVVDVHISWYHMRGSWPDSACTKAIVTSHGRAMP